MPTPLPSPALGPCLTVTCNGLSLVCLLLGYFAIRQRRITVHKRYMVTALVFSCAFLIIYLTHHALHGSTHYPFRDWTYAVYLIVLIPHSLIAALIVPFAVRGVWLAWRERYDAHARLMRRVWPVWIYVSATGVLVFLMLYIFPHWRR
ncbi:MAG: DUF420 domain-containing protein [Verrucomicrobia bacterium]|nr:DUF420 domain-containing protein [Verrucomicrobiota bacterium]